MQFARLFFQDRLYELRDAILAKETEFKSAKALHRMDTRLRSYLTGPF